MTTVKLTASQVEGTDLWIVDPLPQAFHVRSSGATIYGYSGPVARRLAAAWNASLPYTVEEVELGVIDAEHTSLEFAVEKIRLLEILSVGCTKHPGNRARRQPLPTCQTCVEMWEAARELREMSAKPPTATVRHSSVTIQTGMLAPILETQRERLSQAVQDAVSAAVRGLTLPLIERKEQPIEKGRLR